LLRYGQKAGRVLRLPGKLEWIITPSLNGKKAFMRPEVVALFAEHSSTSSGGSGFPNRSGMPVPGTDLPPQTEYFHPQTRPLHAATPRKSKERGCRPSAVKGLRFAPIHSSAVAPEWTSP
jgi:hypothetical protein